jgi:CMP/dCMP kinase
MGNSVPIAATIAIDGPAGAGKTVVGRAVARELGYLFLDTGAMYRALTHLALKQGIDLTDEQALAGLAERSAIDVRSDGPADGRPYSVLAGGEDVTWQIRRPEVSNNVSLVSAWPAVRRVLVRRQGQLAARGCCVLAGRDIGTVVLPQADLKIFLVASLAERVQRRALELRSRGEAVDVEELQAEMVARDALDSGRAASPLKPAADAHVLDSSGLSVAEVVARIVALAREGA